MKVLALDDLLGLPADVLKTKRDDARELLEIVTFCGVNREDIQAAREVLPAFIRRVERALAIQRKVLS